MRRREVSIGKGRIVRVADRAAETTAKKFSQYRRLAVVVVVGSSSSSVIIQEIDKYNTTGTSTSLPQRLIERCSRDVHIRHIK